MIVAICSLFASCMGDSYAETDENMPSPYGNNELKRNEFNFYCQSQSKICNTNKHRLP